MPASSLLGESSWEPLLGSGEERKEGKKVNKKCIDEEVTKVGNGLNPVGDPLRDSVEHVSELSY